MSNDPPLIKGAIKPHVQIVATALLDVLKQHAAELTSQEMLALCANLTGRMLPLQDEQMTQEMAMELVAKNIQSGEMDAHRQLLQNIQAPKGTA